MHATAQCPYDKHTAVADSQSYFWLQHLPAKASAGPAISSTPVAHKPSNDTHSTCAAPAGAPFLRDLAAALHPAHGAFVANLHCPRPRGAWPWTARNGHGAADADARERASVLAIAHTFRRVARVHLGSGLTRGARHVQHTLVALNDCRSMTAARARSSGNDELCRMQKLVHLLSRTMRAPPHAMPPYRW